MRGNSDELLVQFIVELFRNEDAAREFVVDPAVSLSLTRASATSRPNKSHPPPRRPPPGPMLAADPIAGLQQAVSNQFGIVPIGTGVSADAAASSAVDGEPGSGSRARGAGLTLPPGAISDSALELGVDGGSALAAAFGAGLGSALESDVALGAGGDLAATSTQHSAAASARGSAQDSASTQAPQQNSAAMQLLASGPG